MGRKSRRKKERREGQENNRQSPTIQTQKGQSDRASQLEAELTRMSGGDCAFSRSPGLPPDQNESHLEDILAFESLGSGPSLFQGLLSKGIELPRPETLDERRCAAKVFEILRALMDIQVFITGFEEMTPKEAYSKFWHETLREGCYVEKKTPGAITVIDASHTLSPSDLNSFLQDLHGGRSVH